MHQARPNQATDQDLHLDHGLHYPSFLEIEYILEYTSIELKGKANLVAD